MIPERYPYRVALGLESRDEFLSRALPVYKPYKFLEQQKGNSEKLLSIGNDFRVYTSSRVHGLLGSSHLRHQLVSFPPTQKLRDTVRRLGYEYLLIDWNQVNTFYEPDFFAVPVIDESFLSRFTQLEFASSNVYLYRILGDEMKSNLAQDANLLSNIGFEQINAENIPANWFPFGEVQVHAAGTEARSGKIAVQVRKGSCFFQRVSIVPGQLYTLAHWTKAKPSPQNARLQINWVDDKLNLIDASIQVVQVQSNWRWHKMSVTSPKGAAFAHVYVSAHEMDEVWFDDFQLVQGALYSDASGL